MNNTPEWTLWCSIFTELKIIHEKMKSHENFILSLVQHDLNIPGKDRTEEILEKHTDLTYLKENLQPLLNAISKLESEEKDA